MRARACARIAARRWQAAREVHASGVFLLRAPELSPLTPPPAVRLDQTKELSSSAPLRDVAGGALLPAPPVGFLLCSVGAVLDNSAQTLFLTEMFRGMSLTLRYFFDTKVTVSV